MPGGNNLGPAVVAKAAGLRYVSDTSPGIRRKRVGKNFSYIGLDGKPIHDQEELKRIRSLGIPPAWTNVWICPRPNGHIQATGRDAKGRKQYRYHSAWQTARTAGAARGSPRGRTTCTTAVAGRSTRAIHMAGLRGTTVA